MKKGNILSEYGIAIIIVLIILIILSVFLTTIIKGTDQKIQNSECAKSIIAHAKALNISKGEYAPEITCPTNKIMLKGDEENIKRAIADKMVECQQTWLSGGPNLFEDDGTYCHICYIIDFKKPNQDITDFSQFLANEYYTGTNNLYVKVLAGKTNDPTLSDELIKTQTSLLKTDIKATEIFNTSTTKAIMFYYVKGQDNIKNFYDKSKSVLGNTAIGVTVGVGVVATVAGVGCVIAIIGTGGLASIPCIGLMAGGVTGGILGGVIGYVTADVHPQWLYKTVLLEYDKDEIARLDCEIAPSNQNNLN